MPIDTTLYDQLSDTWWEENSVLGSLRTSVNPGRLEYFTQILRDTLHLDPRGKHILDVGCGGGFLAEEFARLGGVVTGIDPSAPSLATASKHASTSGLQIAYHVGVGERIPAADRAFDIVSCCDVLEHVSDVGDVLAEIARVLKPDGVFLFDTINRTFLSQLIVIKLLQEWPVTRVLPSNLHAWRQFITPKELGTQLRQQGLVLREVRGLQPHLHPLVLLALVYQYKRGKLALGALSQRLQFQSVPQTALLYAGYAVPTGGSVRAR